MMSCEEESYGMTVSCGPLGMSITYDIWDSKPDGSDFSYTYHLDPDNAKKFMDKLGTIVEEELQKIIEDKFGKNYYESKLGDYFENEGIHGKLSHYVEYPSGTEYSSEF